MIDTTSSVLATLRLKEAEFLWQIFRSHLRESLSLVSQKGCGNGYCITCKHWVLTMKKRGLIALGLSHHPFIVKKNIQSQRDQVSCHRGPQWEVGQYLLMKFKKCSYFNRYFGVFKAEKFRLWFNRPVGVGATLAGQLNQLPFPFEASTWDPIRYLKRILKVRRRSPHWRFIEFQDAAMQILLQKWEVADAMRLHANNKYTWGGMRRLCFQHLAHVVPGKCNARDNSDQFCNPKTLRILIM